MQKIHQTVFIQASKEKVWNTMLDDATYREWTNAFNLGSHYIGDWSKGSKILFVGSSENGESLGGMVSQIADNRPYEFISIEHKGILNNGVEDYTSDEVKKWAPSFENYTFIEKEGGTEVQIDVDIQDEYKAMFEEMWTKGLQRLKEIAEK